MFDLRGAFAVLAFFAPAIAQDDRLLTAQDIAVITGMTRWWVYNRFSHEVPPIKLGSASRWEMWRVRKYLDEHRTDIGR